jgi:hypothetical protein
MLRSRLDHIVITAPTLAVGVDYVSQALGVAPQMGAAEHPRMGTHACFWKLGERTYLEVIAVNPNAPPPQRPRWFAVDRVRPDDLPRLATWVARTDDIEAAASTSPTPLGPVEQMTRSHLHWQITIPEDGSLPCHGVAPALIRWAPGTHTATTLKDVGCSLVRLEGFHPDPKKVSAILAAIGFEGNVSLRPLPSHAEPYLVAHIMSPRGLVTLGEPRP